MRIIVKSINDRPHIQPLLNPYTCARSETGERPINARLAEPPDGHKPC